MSSYEHLATLGDLLELLKNEAAREAIDPAQLAEYARGLQDAGVALIRLAAVLEVESKVRT